MNQKQTFSAIRAMGLTASFNTRTREYRVTFPSWLMDRERQESEAIYETDALSAIGTATDMRKRWEASGQPLTKQ